jgi:hypothetical protein
MTPAAPGERGERQQDFRLLIGPEPFDPREVETLARHRGVPELSGEREAAKEATIVQFAAALTGPDVDRLVAAYGLKLDRYIPNLAYLERLPAETVARVGGDFLVRACIPLDPTLKLSPSIGLVSEQLPPGSPLELTAVLFDDGDISAVEPALGTVGARDVQIVDDRPIGGRLHARFMLDDLTRTGQIAGIDDVVWVEPVPEIAINNVDAAQVHQSGGVGSSPIWDHKLHGEGQVIGVIDRGPIAIDHCFFADGAMAQRKVLKMFNDTNSPVDVVRAEDPKSGHATIVASIAAGDELGNSGAHKHRGGAWAAKLVCSNQLDMQKPQSRSFLHILKRAKDARAFIHSNSWSNTLVSLYDKRAADADAFSWANEDHLVVAAGGNTPDRINTPPGTAKNTLCVMAAKAFPFEMHRGSGVDGPTRDKRRKPEIVAIGGDLEAAVAGTACDTRVNKGSHTSLATPHVAAAAALVRQYFMEGWYSTGTRRPENAFPPTGALLKAVLLNSTVDMTGEPGYPSDAEGWGLIRLNRALYFDGAPRRLVAQDVRRAVGLESGDTRMHTLSVNNRSEQLKITLVWTDPPPSEFGYANPSQNVIKMTVEDPEGLGVQYLGNDIDVHSGVSRPEGDGPQDLLNNVQMVIVNNPPIGKWTITLRADTVLADEKPYRQGYAIAASGGLKPP